MQDKIIIKDLLVRGVVGIYDWERKIKQDILLNMIKNFLTKFLDSNQISLLDMVEITPALFFNFPERLHDLPVVTFLSEVMVPLLTTAKYGLPPSSPSSRYSLTLLSFVL